ncbi:Alpha/Beta hydrolase protein [Aspergillus spectabilis]
MILKIPLFLLLAAAASSATLIPRPPGPYSTVYNTAQLTDTTRLDPFSPHHNHRTVLTSSFIPTHCPTPLQETPYLPPATATYYTDLFATSNGLNLSNTSSFLHTLNLQTCPRPSHLNLNFPLLIFSPGFGTTRHLYHILAQEIANEGFIVISLDHPYDTEILEFPNGNIIPGMDLNDTQIPLDVQTRAQDISFIIDQLSTPSGCSTLLGLRNCKVNGLRTDRVGVYGHSLGGAAAAEAMRLDSRIVAGINLDGTMFAPVIETGLHIQSFLLFGHENKTQDTDPTWKEFWGHSRGAWKVELELTGAQHYTFSDLPFLLQVLGVDVHALPGVEGRIGGLEGGRVVEVLRGVVGGFFGVGLGGGSVRGFLERLSGVPEARIVAQ